MFTLFQFSLDRLWIAKECIALVDSLHLYESIACTLLLLYFLLELLDLCNQLLFALRWRQIAEIVL